MVATLTYVQLPIAQSDTRNSDQCRDNVSEPLGYIMLPSLSSVLGEKYSLVSQQVVIVDLSGTCCWVSTLTNRVTLPLKLSNFAETASVKINDKKKMDFRNKSVHKNS